MTYTKLEDIDWKELSKKQPHKTETLFQYLRKENYDPNIEYDACKKLDFLFKAVDSFQKYYPKNRHSNQYIIDSFILKELVFKFD
jgi:hypothetical protein